MTDGPAPQIDPALYREVMGHYPTGVAVVTALDDGEPIGMVVGTFSSVSLEPPLVAFMPASSSGTYARLSGAPAYCINVLAHDQLDLCRTMAVPRSDKFDGVEWELSDFGAPALTDAVAQIHCVKDTVVAAGDHDIVLCRVVDMAVSNPSTPLLFFQGGYGGFSPRGMAARGDADLITAIRGAERARSQVDRLATALQCEASCLVQISPDELTTAISSYSGSASMSETLGRRMPLMPPIGEAWVASGPPQAVEHWLSKTLPDDAEVVERYRRRLAAIRARGFAISVVSPGCHEQYEQLGDAIIEFVSGQFTPARERELRSAIAGASTFFSTVDICIDDTYELGSITVPVHNPEGEVVLALRVRQLPLATGRTVNEWIQLVMEAAAQVELGIARHSTEEATASRG